MSGLCSLAHAKNLARSDATTFSGIQLKRQSTTARNGRLVVCCDHQDHLDFANNGNETWSHSHLVYSDDGESWKVGGVADRLTNECAVAEVWRPPFAFLLFGSKAAGTRFAQLWNGTIVVNSRDYLGQKEHTTHRAISWSDSGGESLSHVFRAPSLPTRSSKAP